MGEALKDWMPLSMVSMPGTHNSASFAIGQRRLLPAPVVAASRCQAADVSTQLRRGVRFLDLRVRYGGRMCHGVVDCGFHLADVLATCAVFLRTHSGETIVVRIKDESPNKHSAQDLNDLVKSLAQEYPLFLERRLPRIGEVRGRIVVLSDWGACRHRAGLRWGTSMSIQDHFRHGCGRDKWRAVRRHFGVQGSSHELRINFTSATSLPNATPLRLARSVNRRLALYLGCISRDSFLGIVPMDFPSELLCELIVRRNRCSLDPLRAASRLRDAGVEARCAILRFQHELVAVADALAVGGEADPRNTSSLSSDAGKSCATAVARLASILVKLAHARVAAELKESAVEEPSAAASPSLQPKAHKSLMGAVVLGKVAAVPPPAPTTVSVAPQLANGSMGPSCCSEDLQSNRGGRGFATKLQTTVFRQQVKA